MKIGFLGPKGTFSHEACKEYNNRCKRIEYNSIFETIEALQNGEVDEIIVPIENSLQGGVTETIDTLVEEDGIYVKQEIVLKIEQNLLAGKKMATSEITELYSHPQALAQCRNYINKNLKNAKINKVSSTAMAARELSNKKNAACIANLSCVEEYGLELIAENIQDNDGNETKFWVLSKRQNENGTKMSIIFSTKNKPGSLYKVLGVFYKNNINLCKIESRPAKTRLGEYIFLVDIDVSENIQKTLEQLKKECPFLKILGVY